MVIVTHASYTAHLLVWVAVVPEEQETAQQQTAHSINSSPAVAIRALCHQHKTCRMAQHNMLVTTMCVYLPLQPVILPGHDIHLACTAVADRWCCHCSRCTLCVTAAHTVLRLRCKYCAINSIGMQLTQTRCVQARSRSPCHSGPCGACQNT